ncbi:aryl-sulfate sulfotransferase [Halorientalis salina]|uniref:aryl-sulfate sulfotransferase n=1 Tax=Halorientalis salina TaxID=2932266 RepID=UPI0010AD7674|nr:aryl-sulfate sulfotransferase [Halorientalis salina]
MRLSRSTALVVAGLLLVSVTLVVSAATAPDRTVERADADGNATDAADGDAGVLVGSQGGGPEWKKKGSVYRLDGQDVAWKINDRDSYFDVTPLSNGSVVAGFMHNGYESDCGPYESPCTKTGFRVIDPTTDEPRVVNEWSFPLRTPTHSEVHDVEPLGNGRFLVADMEYERLVVVANGSVDWEWHADSFYDAPEDPTKRDWLHINDVDVIGEDRYLISVRNANQLLVVERGEGVVEVVNEDRSDEDDDACTGGRQLSDFDGDGDVRCGDPDVLDHQHNPQWLGNGTVLVADSDNDRVVELHRSEDGRWEPAWSLDSAAGLELHWPRDADRLENGNTLVTDSLNRRVFEVTEGGEVVWSKETPLIPYEADSLPRGEVTTYDPLASARNDTRTPNATGLEYEASGTVDASGDVPVLSLALVGLQALYPKLPVWFGELQLGLSVVAVFLIGGGLVDRYGIGRGLLGRLRDLG